MHHAHTPAWHAAEEVQERAWLDDWSRLHHTPNLEQPTPAQTAPVLTLVGSTR